MPAAPAQRGHTRLLLLLGGVALIMVVFAFAVLPPMYRFFCEVAGAQYNPNSKSATAQAPVATGRYLEVFFESKVFDNLPVRFWADEQNQRVEIGASGRNTYHFQNLSTEPVRFRPIHQVSPSQVAKSFTMPICFCFNDQEIGPGETRVWPVVYVISADVDRRIQDMTICYSLLALVEGESKEASEERVKSSTRGQGDIVTPRYQGLNADTGAK